MLPRTPLLTSRLCMRPYELTDAPEFFALLDGDRGRFRTSFPDRLQAVRTLPDATVALRAFADDWRTGRFYVFGLWHRAHGTYLGDICIMPQSKGQAEIGYYLAAAAEGHGYAREALAAVVQFGFGALGSQRLLIRCYAQNARGQAVARAAGFLPEPQPRRPLWFRNADAVGNIQRFVLTAAGRLA
ncbi:GNAT family N-acetyltransferase [Hymenobacter sp. BT770]|uniref:GNAT family N-acetyltransferase n=1 Tax=Hymenobacter sp. BT770 TaxID=2886942 RepID=UPI001D0F7B2B|nr:GNAT family N-acetyltransferase [Hymenobacter sp. BT770]MCC3151837.1 GNAT family N-acetyltransferase [Hymenobacter sp. BT770]MDO3413541.1 GNAT family N-acetyltransferase [Hymenobacter sp. BT770]